MRATTAHAPTGRLAPLACDRRSLVGTSSAARTNKRFYSGQNIWSALDLASENFTARRKGDPSDGSLPGYSFLYDEHAKLSGGYYYFTGVEAEAAYGSKVPLNTQILDHLGNVSPAPGSDLDLDLMHGTPTRYQRRYYPTDVDAGILADLGLPVVGTPAAIAVCSARKALAKGVRKSKARAGP